MDINDCRTCRNGGEHCCGDSTGRAHGWLVGLWDLALAAGHPLAIDANGIPTVTMEESCPAWQHKPAVTVDKKPENIHDILDAIGSGRGKRHIADLIGVSRRTLYLWMERGVRGTDHAVMIIAALERVRPATAADWAAVCLPPMHLRRAKSIKETP